MKFVEIQRKTVGTNIMRHCEWNNVIHLVWVTLNGMGRGRCGKEDGREKGKRKVGDEMGKRM